jgi:hypothetical protein
VKDIYKHVAEPLLQRVSTKQTMVIVGTRIDTSTHTAGTPPAAMNAVVGNGIE